MIWNCCGDRNDPNRYDSFTIRFYCFWETCLAELRNKFGKFILFCLKWYSHPFRHPITWDKNILWFYFLFFIHIGSQFILKSVNLQISARRLLTLRWNIARTSVVLRVCKVHRRDSININNMTTCPYIVVSASGRLKRLWSREHVSCLIWTAPCPQHTLNPGLSARFCGLLRSIWLK